MRMRHAEHLQMDVIAVKTECGSAMCVAGHVLDLAGYKKELRPDWNRSSVLDYDFVAPSGHRVKSPLFSAAKEMGLSYRRTSGNKAFELFHDMDLDTPRKAADRIQRLIEQSGDYR